jgi:hypothetical protein
MRLHRLVLVMLSVLAVPDLEAQTGRSAANPFATASAGEAMRRIAFGAFETPIEDSLNCAGEFCAVFANGGYNQIRDRFCVGGAACDEPEVAEFLLNRVIMQSQTFPTASSASGFVFAWGGGATPSLTSELYGPLYAERGLTNGRRQLSATLTYQRLFWRSLDGSELRNDDPGLAWGDFNYDGLGSSYVGLCRMNIDTDMLVGALNYGVTDRLDVRVAVPWVRTRVEGSNEFVDFAVQGNQLTAVGAETGFVPQGRYYVEGESSGLGDIELGAKFAVVSGTSGALALSGAVRLGTGSAEDMTGTGETQGRVSLIGSLERGPLSPHVQVGFFGAGEALYDEVNYVGGLSVRAIPNRLTLNAEFVGRRLFGVQGFRAGREFGRFRSVNTSDTLVLREFVGERNDIDLFFVAGGARARLWSQLLATAYVLVPTGGAGLQARRPTASVGLNYAF